MSNNNVESVYIFPDCKEQYYFGICNCLKISKDNFYEYLTCYKINCVAEDCCCCFSSENYCYQNVDNICTVLGCPIKLPFLLPICPFTTFCPYICECCDSPICQNIIHSI